MGRSINELANNNLTVGEFEEDIRGMEYDDLFTLRTELDMAIQRIKGQLNTSKDKAKDLMEKEDHFWKNRATVAMRFKGQFIQLVEREMGRIRRDEKVKRVEAFGELFVQKAKELLDDDSFRKIADTVKAQLAVPEIKEASAVS